MRDKPYMKPYIISFDKGVWYCHHRNYPYIPVFGSIGEKEKAQKVCDIYNRSKGAKA